MAMYLVCNDETGHVMHLSDLTEFVCCELDLYLVLALILELCLNIDFKDLYLYLQPNTCLVECCQRIFFDRSTNYMHAFLTCAPQVHVLVLVLEP